MSSMAFQARVLDEDHFMLRNDKAANLVKPFALVQYFKNVTAVLVAKISCGDCLQSG